MNTLLVDLWQSGHHLEQLERTQRHLEAGTSGGSVEVVLPNPTSRTGVYFDDDDDVTYALDDDFEEMIAEDRTRGIVTALHCVFDIVEDHDPDVVHFVELDRIVNGFYHVVQERATDATLVASLNGAFFTERPTHVTVRNRVRSLPGVDFVVDRLAPTTFRTREHALGRCLEESLLDCLFVPTVEARDAVRRTTSERPPPIRVVPDPTDAWNDDEYGKAEARSELDLPDDRPVLLFFGEMRREKGVDVLFRAMEEYRGESPITLVAAGPTTEETEIPVDRIDRTDGVRLITDLRFVPPEDTKTYFLATDGVVVPYRRSFGRARPSGVFQKAVASSSPVVAPDFGVFSRRVAEYDLGLLFEPESPASLRDAVARFARSDGDVVSTPESLRAFARLQSYERYAKILQQTYRRLLG